MAAIELPTASGVLAIDGGNSKTDVVFISPDGTVRGSARGPGFVPHIVGANQAVSALAPVVAEAAEQAGIAVHAGVPIVAHVSACLANADLPREQQQIESEFLARGWGSSAYVDNDTFALLRAGLDHPPGVAVVCGAGINCSGLLPDGTTARFAAVGKISGDWGGGAFLADEAMWWAARDADGRGPRTALSRMLPEHFGLADMAELIEAFHLETFADERKHEAVPVLFAAATDGDPVATGVVRRQAEEIVVLASTALERLDLLDESVDVVLGGGVLTAGHAVLLDRIDELLSVSAPKALARVVSAPPVVGAALLGLDRIGSTAEAQARLRAEFPGQ
jgi:N-acetylglucosamine kinase-like BadF-type ATPase